MLRKRWKDISKVSCSKFPENNGARFFEWKISIGAICICCYYSKQNKNALWAQVWEQHEVSPNKCIFEAACSMHVFVQNRLLCADNPQVTPDLYGTSASLGWSILLESVVVCSKSREMAFLDSEWQYPGGRRTSNKGTEHLPSVKVRHKLTVPHTSKKCTNSTFGCVRLNCKLKVSD